VISVSLSFHCCCFVKMNAYIVILLNRLHGRAIVVVYERNLRYKIPRVTPSTRGVKYWHMNNCAFFDRSGRLSRTEIGLWLLWVKGTCPIDLLYSMILSDLERLDAKDPYFPTDFHAYMLVPFNELRSKSARESVFHGSAMSSKSNPWVWGQSVPRFLGPPT